MTHDEIKLSTENILALLAENHIAEGRGREFYAVAQLLAEGELTPDEQKQIGKACVKMIERDHWWRSHGAFNDE